jgi:hypothetical protein
MQQIQNEMSSRNAVNEQYPSQNNRSKKNLNQIHQNGYNYPPQPPHSNVGVYNPAEGNLKIRNYYDMLEKNRRNEKIQNDLTKIYMVNGVQSVVTSPVNDQIVGG